MDFNNKKLTRTKKVIHYAISILLAIFLIGLANRIIWDLDEQDARPIMADFEGQTEIHKYRIIKNSIEDSILVKRREQEALQLKLDLGITTLNQEKQSFQSWISTRTATQSSAVDREVRLRNLKMDSIQGQIQSLEEEKTSLITSINVLREESGHIQDFINEENVIVNSLHTDAVRAYDLNVFFKRLLFVLPILILGVWLLVKRRKSNYWPLYRGFVFFSLYAFFVGLVPYLPSYGGYIRYAIGILLSVFLGIYAIRSFQSFIKRKKEELQQSTEKRSQQIKQEVAEKALENHICPSCGKDYLINEIFQSGGKKGVGGTLKVTNYCRHCGLQLFKDCDTCETKNYAHLPHCYSCGDHITIDVIHKEELIENNNSQA